MLLLDWDACLGLKASTMKTSIKQVLGLLLGAAGVLAMPGCFAGDARWEGDIDSCDPNLTDAKAMLILDTPSLPTTATGWFGTSGEDQSDTWAVTQIEDGTVSGPGALDFTATFHSESSSSIFGVNVSTTSNREYKIELKADGQDKYKGSVRLNIRTTTTTGSNVSSDDKDYRCDIRLKAVKN